MSCEHAFARSLRRKGFRLTPQREMILAALHKLDGMVTADRILTEVQSTSKAVDISTVYRTLELLQSLGVVASVPGNEGQRRFELIHNHGPHVHLVCRSCGAVIGADLDDFRPLMARVEGQYGFRVGVEQLSISGLCEKCCAGSAERDIIAGQLASESDTVSS